MKKHILFIVLFLTFCEIIQSQNDGTLKRIRINTSIYTNCDLKFFIKTLYRGVKVYTESPICKENMFSSQVIKIRTNDSENLHGWVFLEDLMSNESYSEDSIQNAIKLEKQKEYVRKRDSAINVSKEIEKKKNDSLNIETYKFFHTKSFWITELYAYEYSDQSTGIVVKFLNTSNKSIKYINFTVVPYNRVDDLVVDDIGNSLKSCKLIGPIEPDNSGTYEKDILFFSGIVEYYKLKNISVQYMDNTIKYFNYSDIRLIK